MACVVEFPVPPATIADSCETLRWSCSICAPSSTTRAATSVGGATSSRSRRTVPPATARPATNPVTIPLLPCMRLVFLRPGGRTVLHRDRGADAVIVPLEVDVGIAVNVANVVQQRGIRRRAAARHLVPVACITGAGTAGDPAEDVLVAIAGVVHEPRVTVGKHAAGVDDHILGRLESGHGGGTEHRGGQRDGPGS